jgi:polyhydroxyalkanoate synthesis regulator phasin
MAKTRRTAKKPVPRAATPARALDLLAASARQALNVSTRTAVARAQEARDLVSARVAKASSLVAERAVDARSRTAKAISGFERAFERRVSQAVSKLGVPTSRDVRLLERQVAELQASVNQLRRARSRAARA